MEENKQNPNRPTRRSIRLPGYDYASTGTYFVTICAEKREPVFEIPELRTCLFETWQALPERFPGMTLNVPNIFGSAIIMNTLFIMIRIWTKHVNTFWITQSRN